MHTAVTEYSSSKSDVYGCILKVQLVSQFVPNIRHHREELRKKHWIPIAKMREQPEPTVQKAAKYTGDQGAGVDLAPIILEIVINGDGGEYLDHIVQPLFQFLAYQVSTHPKTTAFPFIHYVPYI